MEKAEAEVEEGRIFLSADLFDFRCKGGAKRSLSCSSSSSMFRLLPLETSRGGPSLSAGGGAECGGGRGHPGLKCGFQDGGGLWRMAMTAAFVPGWVNDAAPGKEPPHPLFPSEDRRGKQESSERRAKKRREKY